MIGTISKGDPNNHGETKADFPCSWTLINLGKISVKSTHTDKLSVQSRFECSESRSTIR